MKLVLWGSAGAAATIAGLALAAYTLTRWRFSQRERWLRRALVCNPSLSGVAGGLSVLAASSGHDEVATATGLVAIGFFVIGVVFTVAHGFVARSSDT